jgi:putative hydrolase of HD superfamily
VNFLDFLKTIGKLKTTPRTGWITHGKIDNPESVADHTMRLSVIALLAGDELEINKDKLVKMAILHDLAESITGDIVNEIGSKKLIAVKEEKHKLEEEAMKFLFKDFKNKEELLRLWEEIESRKTKEADILDQLDKFEMVLQAFEYEQQYDKNLEVFWQNAKMHIKHPKIKKWLGELEVKRSSFK